MISFLKKNSVKIGLIITVTYAVFIYGMTLVAYSDFDIYTKMAEYLFDCGVDAICAMTSAALFFGCMKQDGDGARLFRTMIAFVSSGFLANFLMYFSRAIPGWRVMCFVFIYISKLIDIAMIFFFYRYMKKTLNFHGKLLTIADKILPLTFILENVILFSNIFYPVTFYVNEQEQYQSTGLNAIEYIYVLMTTVITTILIVRSKNPHNQKSAALTFLYLPIINYIVLAGSFGNASMYGMYLMSLIIMYCIIFNDKNAKLAATQNELNMATQIQTSMLPTKFPAFPERDEFDLYASMDPAKEVGGDFYDFFMIDDDHLGVVIADVSGKGVPAALFMTISKTVVQNYALLGINAAEVLTKANDALCAQNKMKMFVTTWIGILELSTGKMNCASAGHEYPALYHNGKFELYKDKRKIALAAMKGRQYIDYEIQLYKNDKLFLYTDGVPEATDENKELFGTDRMIDALNIKPEADPKEILQIVRSSVDKFVGSAEQFDDLTMVCVEYKG